MDDSISKDTAILELTTITPFQKEYHTSSPGGKADDIVMSPFSKPLLKTTWNNHFTTRVEKQNLNDDEYLYIIDSDNWHLLTGTTFYIDIPALSVKTEYADSIQICWPKNLAHQILELSHLLLKETYIQSIDKIWMDMVAQFYQPPKLGLREEYDERIGNVPYLVEWNVNLPSTTLICSQPWYYSESLDMAFPLFLLKLYGLGKLQHKHTFNLKISKLLRMRVKDKDTGLWTELSRIDLSVLNGVGKENLPKIPPPTMEADYVCLSTQEIETYFLSQEKITYYTKNIISVSGEEPKGYGSRDCISISTPGPCLAIHWVAENKLSSMKRNLSNYTTNNEDSNLGWNPCAFFSLNYSKTIRYAKSPHYVSEFEQPRKYALSMPYSKGFNMLSFRHSHGTPGDPDIGIVLKIVSAKLKIYLEDTDPRKHILTEDDIEDPKKLTSLDLLERDTRSLTSTLITERPFLVHVRMLVLRKLEFKRIGDQKTGKYIVKIIDADSADI